MFAPGKKNFLPFVILLMLSGGKNMAGRGSMQQNP
jgi:hypothetical protein